MFESRYEMREDGKNLFKAEESRKICEVCHYTQKMTSIRLKSHPQ